MNKGTLIGGDQGLVPARRIQKPKTKKEKVRAAIHEHIKKNGDMF